MNDEICYNVAGGLLLVIIFAALLIRKMTKGLINRAFIYLVLFTLLASILSTASILLNGVNSVSNSLKLVIAILYYIVRNLSFALYPVYIIAVTDTGHVLGKKFFRLFSYIPYVATVFLALSTLFYPYVFFIDRNGYFVKGQGITYLYVCNAINCVYPVIIVHMFMKNLGTRKSIALISCAINSLIAYLLDLSFPFFNVDIVCYALGILFIMLIVQNPESRIDSQSGLQRRAAYFEDTKISLKTKKPIAIIHINILHFDQIANILSYDRLGKFIGHISSRLELMCKRLALSCELYYIKDGKFRVIIRSESFTKLEKTSKAFNNIFNTNHGFDDINMDLKSVVCVTRCPADVDSFDVLYDLESTLDSYDVDGEIIYAKDIIKNSDYKLKSHLSEIIENALNERKFEVFYQPIYNIKTKQFDAVEALLRLYDKTYGDIPPKTIISIAEKDGNIDRIGEYVLEETCKFVASKEFSALGIDRVAMNLSPIQCLRKDLPEKIFETIKKYNIDPGMLVFEITESIASEYQKVFKDNIYALNAGGVKLSLDDFGAGYTNILNVSSFPFSTIKFDKAFVDTGNNLKRDGILVSAIEMIKSIDKKIIIEGAETEDVIRKAEYLNCDYVQGFYFSKALPKEKFIFFVEEYKQDAAVIV